MVSFISKETIKKKPSFFFQNDLLWLLITNFLLLLHRFICSLLIQHSTPTILLLMTRYGESLSTSNRMQKKKKRDMIWYGDLVMGFVIFQGTRFYDASMQKNCSGVGGEYEFSMA